MTVKDSESSEFHFDLAGRVKNLGFAPSPLNALFPVFEAIANSPEMRKGLDALAALKSGDGLPSQSP